MKIYTALLKQNAEPVVVREGFSCGALVFGPFWLAAHRAWIAAAISLAAFVLVAALAPPAAFVILAGGLLCILGLTGHDLRRWALEHRGYVLLEILAAADADDALLRLLNRRPDLADRFRPEPA